MKYAGLITQSKEKADEALAPAKADEQNAALGLEIGKLDLKVKTAQNALEVKKSQYPLPFKEILDASDELALDVRRLGEMKALRTELFS